MTTNAPQTNAVQHAVSLGTAFRYCWTRWTFAGRASRSEYWWATLANMPIGILLPAIEYALWGVPVLTFVYTLAALIPCFGLTVRRLHDIGRSGFWYWVVLVPLVGPIVLLVFELLPSEPGENRFGPVPNTTACQTGE